MKADETDFKKKKTHQEKQSFKQQKSGRPEKQ